MHEEPFFQPLGALLRVAEPEKWAAARWCTTTGTGGWRRRRCRGGRRAASVSSEARPARSPAGRRVVVIAHASQDRALGAYLGQELEARRFEVRPAARGGLDGMADAINAACAVVCLATHPRGQAVRALPRPAVAGLRARRPYRAGHGRGRVRPGRVAWPPLRRPALLHLPRPGRVGVVCRGHRGGAGAVRAGRGDSVCGCRTEEGDGAACRPRSGRTRPFPARSPGRHHPGSVCGSLDAPAGPAPRHGRRPERGGGAPCVTPS